MGSLSVLVLALAGLLAPLGALAQPDEVEIEALSRSVIAEFENYVKLNKKISPEVVSAVTQIEDYAKLADTIASHLSVKIADKQEILGLLSIRGRLEKVLAMMEAEISVLQVEKRIRGRVKRQMEKTQREYYLNEQMKAIQKELGDGEESETRIAAEYLTILTRQELKDLIASGTLLSTALIWHEGMSDWKPVSEEKHDFLEFQELLVHFR